MKVTKLKKNKVKDGWKKLFNVQSLEITPRKSALFLIPSKASSMLLNKTFLFYYFYEKKLNDISVENSNSSI